MKVTTEFEEFLHTHREAIVEEHAKLEGKLGAVMFIEVKENAPLIICTVPRTEILRDRKSLVSMTGENGYKVLVQTLKDYNPNSDVVVGWFRKGEVREVTKDMIAVFEGIKYSVAAINYIRL